MHKKFSIVILCIVLLLSFAACRKNEIHQNNNETNQTENSTTSDVAKEDNTTSNVSTDNECTNEATSSTSANNTTLDNNTTENSVETSNTTENTIPVFKTDNVTSITFYAYYGSGKGGDVPAEHLNEIISWLDSFKVDTDREFPELVPPGTNTIHIEIKYSDGSIIKLGMDTTTVDGVTYYIKGATRPECYDEIISKTSLS